LDFKSQIKALLSNQKLAVLSTHSASQPYSNLIAFAECEDCQGVIFFTPKNTRKYQNLLENKEVALLIDNRTNQNRDFNDAMAVTILGLAEEIDIIKQKRLAAIFGAKHPDLMEYVNKDENVLFKVTISEYIVATFNKSVQMKPD
jgi:nitroimidazol reductase NimA-like FMN-containing flavoprotein (pyridoxamine 5'-phosphate oxidase superfamily)